MIFCVCLDVKSVVPATRNFIVERIGEAFIQSEAPAL